MHICLAWLVDPGTTSCLPTSVTSKSPNLLALGVLLPACERQAAPETGPGGLLYI